MVTNQAAPMMVHHPEPEYHVKQLGSYFQVTVTMRTYENVIVSTISSERIILFDQTYFNGRSSSANVQ